MNHEQQSESSVAASSLVKKLNHKKGVTVVVYEWVKTLNIREKENGKEIHHTTKFHQMTK